MELEDGVPEDCDRSLFADDQKDCVTELENEILRVAPEANVESSTIAMLASYLQAHQYRFDQGSYTIEVYIGEGEDSAIVTKEAEMIKSSYVRFKIIEN